MVAPNQARRGKADHPALPVTTDGIVDCARGRPAAGADALHMHVRDAEGRHSLDVGHYTEMLADLEAQVPALRLLIPTEAAGVFDVGMQLNCLMRVRRGGTSICSREISREPGLAPCPCATGAKQGTEVQHVLHDHEDIDLLKDWQARGIVRPGRDAMLFELGRYALDQISDPGDLDPVLAAMPDVADWMICAFGPAEHACLVAAARQGGAIRVRFEKSLTDCHGNRHADNAASVAALRIQLERRPS